jgi:hypothetical protein
MSRQKTKTTERTSEDRVNRVLQNLTHRELQRECVLRGLESENVVGWSHHKLVSWFHEHFDDGQDFNRLTLHDAWVDGKLKEKGYKQGDALFSPALKFGYTGDVSKVDRVKAPKAEKQVPSRSSSKPPVEVDEVTKVRKGTKKSLTYDCAVKDKLSLEDTIAAVKEAFPDAEEKSIKIWYKRALREVK